MSDIVDRLRKVESSYRSGSDVHVTNWYRNPDGPEAADEIERLQADLEEAERLIADAVQIMTPTQVGQWAGVRAWQERSDLPRRKPKVVAVNDGPEPCPTCDGDPGVRPGGFYGDTIPCPDCNGTGRRG